MAQIRSGRRLALLIGVTCWIGGFMLSGRGVEAQDSSVFGQLGSDIDDVRGPIALSGDGARLVIGERSYVHVREWDGREWSEASCSIPLDGDVGSVAISDDGATVAIGAPGQPGTDVAGFVRVVEWNGSGWFAKGADIVTHAEPGSFGAAVAMSADGSRIVIGDPSSDSATVVGWDGSVWLPVGGVIEGAGGEAVAMSADGNRLTVGKPAAHPVAHVRSYHWDGTSWASLGEPIFGRVATQDEFGRSVALSANGSRLVVGAPATESSAHSAVRVFDWNGTDWTQAGEGIFGGSSIDQFGWSIDLSADGLRLIATSPGIGSLEGYVRVLDWVGTGWVPVVDRLDPVPGVPWSGAVAVSNDGQRIARLSGGGRSGSTGRVRVFEEGATTTSSTAPPTTNPAVSLPTGSTIPAGAPPVQVGGDVIGAQPGEQFPRGVEMSADGERFAAVGGSFGRVYGWDGAVWSQLGDDLGPTGQWMPGSIALSGDGSRVALADRSYSVCEWGRGQVRVFEWGGLEWLQLGDSVNSPVPVALLDGELELSRDGSRLAIEVDGGRIGDPESSTSFARRIEIWDWDGAAWRFTLGVPARYADPEQPSDARFELSADGRRVVVWHEHSIEQYHLDVYDIGGTEAVAVGVAIPERRPGGPQMAAPRLAISEDGSRVALGWSQSHVSESQSQIFEWNGSSWAQLGDDVTGRLGSASADLARVGISEGTNIDVHDWDGTRWTPAARIDSPSGSMSMSGAGNRLAIGVRETVARGAGYVRVFALPSPAAAQPTPTSSTSAPNATASSVATPTTTLAARPTLPGTGLDRHTPTVAAAAVLLVLTGAAMLGARRPRSG